MGEPMQPTARMAERDELVEVLRAELMEFSGELVGAMMQPISVTQAQEILARHSDKAAAAVRDLLARGPLRHVGPIEPLTDAGRHIAQTITAMMRDDIAMRRAEAGIADD
jgi:hypothetical protein